MKRVLILVSFCLLFVILCTGCISPVSSAVSFDQLMANPAKYNNKEIIVEAFYFYGFEVVVLAGNLKQSGYAPGHLKGHEYGRKRFA